MTLPPTFVTPVIGLYIVCVIGGYPILWGGGYLISIVIYYLVDNPGSTADWWYAFARIIFGVGACFCGWIQNWYIGRYWAGKRMLSFRPVSGKNKTSSITTGIVISLIIGVFLIYEIVEIDIFNTYGSGLLAITSSYQFGYEAGHNVVLTILLSIGGLIMVFGKERWIGYHFSGPYSWLYISAIVPVWCTYALSFTRYVPNWVPTSGEDWVTQGVNLGFLGLWTLIFTAVGFIWRESVKNKRGSKRVRVTGSTGVE